MLFGIDIWVFIFLVLCLFLVAIFEFINWFHDTANAVAPVIYTKSLEPKYAVFISWVMNFFWVVLGWIWVAMAIVHLLPLEAIGYQKTSFWIIVVISLLLSAIIWNFSTWFLWIPASSSHSLIWWILWVTIAMMYVPIAWNIEVVPNWAKALEVMESLLISPFVWFVLAFVIMLIAYKFIKNKYYFSTPGEWENIDETKPKPWLRALLIAVSAWVSFAHGSNDWQKWVWLAVLILVILVPSIFAVNPNINIKSKAKDISNIQNIIVNINTWDLSEEDKKVVDKTKKTLVELNNISNWIGLPKDNLDVRLEILEFQKNIKDLKSIDLPNSPIWTTIAASVNDTNNKTEVIKLNSIINESFFVKDIDSISELVDYAPNWVIILISLSLWLWTLIWRKRIVVTIWEKIWKTKMNYAQATTSALMTAVTITLASRFHLPVSTTHILSSSVAWSMYVWEKSWWVRWDTVKNILMAWVLTLPVTILLSWAIFMILWFIFVR